MRTKLLTLIAFIAQISFIYAQDNIKDERILKLEKNFQKSNKQLEDLKKEFDDLKSSIMYSSSKKELEDIQKKQQEIINEKEKTDSLYNVSISLKSYMGNFEKVDSTKLEELFLFIKGYKLGERIEENKATPKTYLYFGENKIVDEDLFKNKSTETELLKSLLADVGKENYLGDITIPKEDQRFRFYCENMIDISEDVYKFKKLGVEIRDGYFHDILVYVEDLNGDTHVFTNQIGLSVLFYSQYGKSKFLYYLYSLKKKDVTEDSKYLDYKMSNRYVKVTDVMGYSYQVGNHYIPQDLTVELPRNDVEGNVTNINSQATYQIKQKTYLEKIVELRAYTDFLALFGETQNGLAQIEGKAKFYLFPYPFRLFWSRKTLGQIEFFSTISPHVNYARFGDEGRYVPIRKMADSDNYELNTKLDLVEKRFLTMGLQTEALKWQHKNAPVSISFYGLINYNLSEINMGTEEQKDIKSIKSLNVGGGIQLCTNRFNNFGFTYKFEVSSFDYHNFNSNLNVALPHHIPVVKNEAEIFYHPNGNPNQAIFTRLITFNYKGKENNQAFYQFQFGYKFSIGNKSINK